MKNVLIVFGTRPEAIKMAPVVQEFRNSDKFNTAVCVTAQHREMLDQVLEFFHINPDYDLDLMKPGQDLFTLTAKIISAMKSVLQDFTPDFVFVHGDTTTSMAAALAAFYAGAVVCHVEAGLRTYDKMSPFPEEMNRQLTARIVDYHFAPTAQSAVNLLAEGISEEKILVTGNTVIDALLESANRVDNYQGDEILAIEALIKEDEKLILVTGHRRENHGTGFREICDALKYLAIHERNLRIIYPVHPNPHVSEPVQAALGDVPNISLISPLSYPAFVWMMKRAYIVVTDSGGVQEEAPSLGKPVILMRNNTERPEAVKAGTVILVGTDGPKMIYEIQSLLHDQERYERMSKLHNPYGDGMAASRIVEFISRL